LPRGTTVSAELGEVLDKLLQDLARDRFRSAVEVLAVLKGQGNSTKGTFTPHPVLPPPNPNKTPQLPPPSLPTSPSIPKQPNTPQLQLQTFEFEVVTLKVVQKSGFFGTRASIETNRRRNTAQFFSEDLGNGISLEIVSIPGGNFLMGSPTTEKERSISETPQHSVTLSPFCMGKFTITQAQWRQVAAYPQIKTALKSDPSYFKGDNLPVEYVSWDEAVEFCARLTKKTGKDYRLPSEAEWEYACRAGTKTPFHFGETITLKLANYYGNYAYGNAPKGVSREKTTPVGSFQVANGFGLYDMHGNVLEWCADHWHSNYEGAPSDGSIWLSSNKYSRWILRGGSWYDHPRNCRSACRYDFLDNRYSGIGFRVVCCAPRTL
jgi:formylglycine-generating enzyme required for sulfatase activity